MTAYTTGGSSRKVDDLVRALGVSSGISKSTVSRICEQLGEEVAAFRHRSLDHKEFLYVFADAPITTAAKITGSSPLSWPPGLLLMATVKSWTSNVGDTEDEVFGTQFLRRLRKRGLGVVLVISDAHTVLKAAIRKTSSGAA